MSSVNVGAIFSKTAARVRVTAVLSKSLRSLTTTAVDLATQANDNEDHTVAAALLTKSGAIVTGVNAFHFLGGPCAEVTALANHATTQSGDPVIAAVAAHGPTSDVLPPCGKCRQVLFDLDPGIVCVVRTAEGHSPVPVRNLLPHPYDWRASGSGPQRIYMWEGYEELVRSGVKSQTVRIDDPFREGTADVVFEKESGEVISIPAVVTEVRTVERSSLTEVDARRDGFDTLTDLHAALDRHYPGLTDDDPVDLVTFDIG